MEVKSFEDLAGLFFSAFNSSEVEVNPMVKLGMWASFLYWNKKGVLSIKENYEKEKSDVLAVVDKEYLGKWGVSVLSVEWVKKGNECLCSDSISDKTGAIAEKYREFFKYSKDSAHYIFDVFNALKDRSLTNEDYKDLFYAGVEHVEVSNGKEFGLRYLPREVQKACSLLIGKSECVYNPHASLHDFVGILDAEEFHVTESQQDARDLGLLLADLAGKAEIVKTCESIKANHQFDAVVSFPSMGQRKWPSNDVQDLIGNFENLTNENGKMLLIVEPKFLYHEYYYSERYKMVYENKLDKIVYLPEGLLHSTRIPLTILLFDRNRTMGAPVRLIDASQMCVRERFINIFDIESFKDELAKETSEDSLYLFQGDFAISGYKWNLALLKGKAEYTIPEGYTRYKVKDILEPIDGETVNTGCKAVILSHYKFSNEPKVLKMDKLETIDASNKDLMVVKTPSICLMPVGGLALVYCNASEETPVVYDRKRIKAFTLRNNDVRPTYLVEILSEIVPMFNEGFGIQRLSISNFLDFEIGIPTLAEQDKIFAEAEQKRIQEKADMIGIDLEKIKEDYRKDVHVKKHAIGQTVAGIGAWINMLKKAMEMGVIDGNAEIGRSRKTSISEIINGISDCKDKLELQLKKFDAGYGLKPEWLVIGDLIKEYIDKNSRPEFEFEFAPHGKSQEMPKGHFDAEENFIVDEMDYLSNNKIHFPKEAFFKIMDNIVSNACSHGFEHGAENKIRFNLELGEEGEIFLYVSNNGKPFKDEILENLFTYGISSQTGKDGHHGIGGYEIKRLMEEFGGKCMAFNNDIEINEEGEVVDTEFQATYCLTFKKTNIGCAVEM